MTAFRVWIRALDHSSRVHVEGHENTQWLLDYLSRRFVFKSCEPVREVSGTLRCTFEVPWSSQLSCWAFEKLLARIPEVTLITEPVSVGVE